MHIFLLIDLSVSDNIVDSQLLQTRQSENLFTYSLPFLYSIPVFISLSFMHFQSIQSLHSDFLLLCSLIGSVSSTVACI